MIKIYYFKSPLRGSAKSEIANGAKRRPEPKGNGITNLKSKIISPLRGLLKKPEGLTLLFDIILPI